MFERAIPLVFLLTACSAGSSEESPGSFGASFSGGPNDSGIDDGTEESTEESTDEESTEETTTTTEESTEEETTETDTETGMEDPCIAICDGDTNAMPNTCDSPYIIGRTAAKMGFTHGGTTNAATNEDTENCGPHDDPGNLDTGKDHFFRIWMYTGDTVTVQQTAIGGWDPRVKIHDEADCVGKAKVCTEDDENMFEYTAAKDDWFTIVVDGISLGFGDAGDYSLSVDLVEADGIIDMCACL